MTSSAKTLRALRWRRTHFGMMADFDVPDDCSIIIVCVNGGRHLQLHPVALLLPHQVYYKDCQEWLKEHDATEITIVPANHKHYIELGNARLKAAALRRKRTGRR